MSRYCRLQKERLNETRRQNWGKKSWLNPQFWALVAFWSEKSYWSGYILLTDWTCIEVYILNWLLLGISPSRPAGSLRLWMWIGWKEQMHPACIIFHTLCRSKVYWLDSRHCLDRASRHCAGTESVPESNWLIREPGFILTTAGLNDVRACRFTPFVMVKTDSSTSPHRTCVVMRVLLLLTHRERDQPIISSYAAVC